MKLPAGKPPQPKKASVVRVESLSEAGHLSVPPKFDYWVVSAGLPPEVYSSGHLTFAAAMNWLLHNNLAPTI